MRPSGETRAHMKVRPRRIGTKNEMIAGGTITLITGLWKESNTSG